MPSPFPGMDPYLESDALWPEFRRQLVAGLYQVLLPGLVDRYRARVATREYSVEMALFTSVTVERHVEEFIEIRGRTGGELVSMVDIVSPANKKTPAGRQAYLDVRRSARSQNASLVEIDLVKQGEPMLDYARDGLPDWDYAVSVTRSISPDRYEIYTATIRKRLPRFRLPLLADDRDTVVDLQAVFARTYDQAGFETRVDYKSDPPMRFKDDDQRWLTSQLEQAGLR